jgi:hypothetical protein
MIFYDEEDYFDVVDDAKEFLEDIEKEVGPFQEEEFRPDWDFYQSLATLDKIAVFTAREESRLVGLAVCFLLNHPYYSGMLVAQSDIIYMKPEYRGLPAAKLIFDMDNRLEVDHGVKGITISMTTGIDFSGLLEQFGYTKTALVCSRYIGDK